MSLTPLQIFEARNDDGCIVCFGWKRKKVSFCARCFRKVPDAIQFELCFQGSKTREYRKAFQTAYDYLMEENEK